MRQHRFPTPLLCHALPALPRLARLPPCRRVHEIARSFTLKQRDDLVQPHRFLHKEGTLDCITSAAGKRETLLVYLFNDCYVLAYTTIAGLVTVMWKQIRFVDGEWWLSS